jgi:hypothetical protein
MAHLVVIADIIASRQLPDRAQIQRRLRESLAARNAAHAEGDLLSPYTLTLGDGLQAVPARAALYKTARAADLYALVGVLQAVEALLDAQLGVGASPVVGGP